MKKIIFCFLLAGAAGGFLFAQNRMGPGMPWGSGQLPAMEKTSVSGVLGITGGHIAVKNGDKTYYLMGLDRYIGFIDGLKEGASAQLEGYGAEAWGTGNEIFLSVTKLTLNGKDYDLDRSNGGYGCGGMNGGGFRGNHHGHGMRGMMPYADPRFR